MQRRLVELIVGCLGVAAAGIGFVLGSASSRDAASGAPQAEPGLARAALGLEHALRVAEEAADGVGGDPGSLDRGLVMPTGKPPEVSCDDARTVVQQVRTSIAAPVSPVDPARFATAANDWLDPHGLWSVAPDAPVGARLKKSAARLLAELEAEPSSAPCFVSLSLGSELATWTAQIRALFDEGERQGEGAAGSSPSATSLRDAFQLASSTPFEDGAVTRNAKDLARELGHQAGVLHRVYGKALDPFVAAARSRAAPDLSSAAWARVATAAALRAYVPQLDAHGAWAPLDEELSIYDLGLEADPPPRLWTERVRTALGVRIDHGALAPLHDGDVVLEVMGIPLAGMSVEQVEQLSVLSDARPGAATRVTVLRAGEKAPLELDVMGPKGDGEAAPSDPSSELGVTMLRYGEGHAAVIPIADVPDDLGARLGKALETARANRDLRGVVLDLRGNGGGSTDGAIAAIGLFLPGVALFPMKRRDGAMEVERAPEVSADKRYSGPLAVLVDGDSASAAEMIAGGLASYHRAVIVGDRTYGKGCAQEYLDDDAHAGVLRLTTLLFALPDGSPLQKTGIVPNHLLSLTPATEHEASMARALGPWRGPDVRDLARVHDVPWPNHGGRLGPCRDATLCRALRTLGTSPAAAR